MDVLVLLEVRQLLLSPLCTEMHSYLIVKYLQLATKHLPHIHLCINFIQIKSNQLKEKKKNKIFTRDVGKQNSKISNFIHKKHVDHLCKWPVERNQEENLNLKKYQG